MNAKLITAALALAMASGCVVYTDDDHHDPIPEPVNYTPYVNWADAGCYWDDYNGDFIWYFEAEVWDDDGWTDISAVYADVFDARGELVDSFELYHENPDPDIWFSDWLQYSTALDCYYGGYTVEVIAYDSWDDYDTFSMYPATYY